MKKRVVDLHGRDRLLDIASFGRASPRLTGQRAVEVMPRRGGRAPEVMVKVSGGARTIRGVAAHLAYIGRRGSLEMESDTGDRIQGKGFQHDLVEDWDLELESGSSTRNVREPRRPPKLVHNIIFSMPPGTPPNKVFRAVKELALNEWALKHRYAMVLHTDEPHPHVHVVLKARSEQGERLNIRKETLRNWRELFASNLRELGVAASATHQTFGGTRRRRVSDGLFRILRREGENTVTQWRHNNVAKGTRSIDQPLQ